MITILKNWRLQTLWCGIAVTLIAPAVAAGQSLRICSYNVLDRPTTAAHDQFMRVVLQAIGDSVVMGNAQAIDVLAFQEGPMAAGEYNDIEANFETVFGGDYESTISGPDFFGCRTGFVYSQDRIQLLAATTLTAGLTHNTRRALFRPVGGTSDDDFYIYSIHLKSGASDDDIRLSEASLIKGNAASLPADTNIIYCGDFNVTGSNEGAYQELVAAGSNATAIDTLNTPFGFRNNVSWQENLAFLPFHTQDPTGNMDDRFDAFYVNQRMIDGSGIEFVAGSLTTLGNNGTHSLDSGINTGNGANGFGDELVAFSDHLPVFADFKIGQIPTTVDFSITANSGFTRFVRPSGPVSGTTGNNNMEIEGSSNGGFAAFGVVDFDLTGLLKSGNSADQIDNIVLQLVQDNATFSDNGPISVYLASTAATNVAIDNSIQYQAGQNGLESVPSVLSTGAQKVATYASVHEINGNPLPDGTIDSIVLFGDELQQAVSVALSNDGKLRFLITADQPGTAATFSGFNSGLGGPVSEFDAVVDDNSSDVFPDSITIANGEQGSGNIVSILLSDDNRLNYTSGLGQFAMDAPIQIQFSGNIDLAVNTSLIVTIESKVNTQNLVQKIEVFNFSEGQWEEISESSSQLTDTTIEVTATGDVSRFAGAGDLILSRVSWTPDGPVLFYPWQVGIDLFKWTVDQ